MRITFIGTFDLGEEDGEDCKEAGDYITVSKIFLSNTRGGGGGGGGVKKQIKLCTDYVI